MTVPVPKPPVIEGNILDNTKWKNAFHALIEDQVVKSNYKPYYLGKYTCGVAQKTISGLLGLRTEDSYKRARKTLKERFGDHFRIYEAYRDKLKTWSPCITSEELQDFSDFLVMTQEAMSLSSTKRNSRVTPQLESLQLAYPPTTVTSGEKVRRK